MEIIARNAVYHEKICMVGGLHLPLHRINDSGEGNGCRSLLYFSTMTIAQKTEKITALTAALIAEEPAYFLVDVKLKPGNNIQVFLDGDAGVSLKTCVAYNRALYKQIEAAGLFPPGDFSLEISSPGVDEPLRMQRQYQKNMGRMVETILKDGRKISGKLLAANEAGITLEETKGKGKKQEVLTHELSFDHIKSTTVQVVF